MSHSRCQSQTLKQPSYLNGTNALVVRMELRSRPRGELPQPRPLT
eukprot:CAMPEP_0197698620 /NCGR_PEP_ID=MMETSP1338-20131121/119557_1 /TAXON_ID=43686 ORGANISM="Pelagodinium beii, Strain RCC1491" /NCGR_SAMPLE_ID=MMETSP1338 /ASSEMBLY_ACC=CAM_ASM_000754 /LENGTH=44 /DNA_ID= /DNA_START= /DNA_END= /DNA_ORIENTATION=